MIIVDVKCDGCGKMLTSGTEVLFTVDANKRALSAGWTVELPEKPGQTWDDHYCPDCTKKKPMGRLDVMEMLAVKQAYSELHRAVYDYSDGSKYAGWSAESRKENYEKLVAKQKEISDWLDAELDQINKRRS